jgi:hypothetical protein
MADPASIRYRNPGGMYPGPSATRFGSLGHEIIGGGHKIAVFPDAESGAAAQFDLLSRNYAGLPLRDAIAKWSGGNASGAYADFIAKNTGLSPDTVLTREMLHDPRMAVPLVRSMAQWEAGRAYPLDDAGWNAAHSRAFGPGQANQPPDAQTQPPTQTAASGAIPNANATSLGSMAPQVASSTDYSPTEQRLSGDYLDALVEKVREREAQSFEDADPGFAKLPGAPAPDLRRVLAVLKNRQRFGSPGRMT